jgi:hypothetical protein
LSDRVQAFIFRPDHLAPIYSDAQVVKWDVTDDFPDTFWRKQGFNWFAGL